MLTWAFSGDWKEGEICNLAHELSVTGYRMREDKQQGLELSDKSRFQEAEVLVYGI